MAINLKQPARSKQLKVWTLLAATVVAGILLAFGRWASDDRMPSMFAYVVRGAFPAGWVLAIEYGVLVMGSARGFFRGRDHRVDDSRRFEGWQRGCGCESKLSADLALSKMFPTAGHEPRRRPELAWSRCGRRC
jgi:hypothetical protein